jgi:uncharacterized protein YkwD
MFVEILVVAAALAADPAASPVNLPVSVPLWQVEKNVLARTNAERARYRLPPLRLDRDLLTSARRHAFWMTRSGNLVHTTANVGENIAMGQRSSTEVVRDWMTSPGHRANILNGRYTRIGVAAYTAADGTVFWCQQFLH